MKAVACFALLFTSALMASAADRFLITIYDQDYAVVRDIRSFDLTKGPNEIRFPNLSPLLLDEPIQISGNGVICTEQQFQFHNVTDDLLLSQSLGKRVDFVLRDSTTVGGILVGQPVGQSSPVDETRYVIEQPGLGLRTIRRGQVVEYHYPQKPLDYQIEPLLTCGIEAEAAGSREVEVKYSLQGLEWSAGYILELTEIDSVAVFSGSARVLNSTGRAFDHARISLVSGQVQAPPKRLRISSDQLATRVTEIKGLLARQAGFKSDYAGNVHVRGGRENELVVAEQSIMYSPPSATAEELFGLSLFTLPYSTSLSEGSEKEFTLIQPTPIKTRTNYVYAYSNHPNRVGVYVSTVNTDSAGLGIALPAGPIRIYRSREGGVSEYVSEYRTGPLAKNAPLRIRVGHAEGLAVTRTQIAAREGSGSRRDETWEIRLQNEREEPVAVTIQEHFPGNWKMLSNSTDYRKTADHTVEFPVTIAPESELVVAYEVRQWKSWKSRN